jgi:hypothetical protein
MVGEAREKGIVPDGEAPPEMKTAKSTLGQKKEAPKAPEFEDIEIDDPSDLDQYQKDGKLHAFGGWKETDKDGEITDRPAKDANGTYGFVAGKSKAIIRVALSLMLLFAFASEAKPVLADTNGTEESVMGNRRWKITSSGNLEPVTDSSNNLGAVGAEVANVYVDAITAGSMTASGALTVTGELTYQGTLLVGGRFAASSTIPSSSNGINPSTIAYSLLLKSIGNVAGETATLPNGTKNGQKLTILCIGCGPSGDWTVTPTKGAGWLSFTMNAKGDQISFTWDSVLGWLIEGAESVTFTTANL